jgi:squalene-hopene/tetraprenyl-beta-curcumene cyclase
MVGPVRTASAPALDVACALAAGQRHLLSLQRPDGCFWGPLESNVAMEAEYILLGHVVGRRDPERERRLAQHILSQQREDGSWAIYPGGPGDVSLGVEAYLALRLAGLAPDDPRLVRARDFVRARGGVLASRVFTRLWLALVGEYPWSSLPVLPPEMALLPPRSSLSLYGFSSWARGTVAALTLVMSRRPVFPLPEGVGVRELWVEGVTPPERSKGGLAAAAFRALDGLLHLYHRRPFRGLRRRGEEAALAYLLSHQEKDGSWGGIQPPWVYALVALKALGQEGSSAFQRGWEGLRGFTVEEPDGRLWLQACVSPVWDTALAVLALRDSGLAADDARLQAAARWLMDHQVQRTDGDWKVRRPQATGRGWSFEFINENYPDVDDTAMVLMALARVRMPREEEARRKEAITQGFRWMVSMQSRGGGWAAYDADQFQRLPTLIPFSDFGAVTDPPSEDVTAHVVEALGTFGYDEAYPVLARAVDYLRRTQHPHGPWFGRWGVNYVYGTGAVLPALRRAGVAMDAPWIQRAVAWLVAHANEDGGWGEDCRSYEDPAWMGRGDSTPSQTAWALLALLAADATHDEAVRRGVAYLLRTQRPDGGWDEARYTGTGFPRDFYIGYRMYRLVFPLMALGRYAQATGVQPAREGGGEGL